MTTETLPAETPKTQDEESSPWLALIVIVLAQIQMSFNVNALPVLVGPITKDLATPATSVATALVIYSLAVAGLVMVGAKLGRLFGGRLVFQVLAGLGEGALLTLMFNVLVAASPRELAGDVGALRGVANNLSTALGTAFASVVAVGLLSVIVTSSLNRSAIPDSLKTQVNLDNINFVTNTHLKDVLARTTATQQQVDEAVAINQEARLRSLRASFLILAGIALLAVFPASRLPKSIPDTSATKLNSAAMISAD
jgi:MFS family permease